MFMRFSLLALTTLLLAAAPGSAQSNDLLEQVTEGWGRGQCDPLTHVGLNPETGAWQTIDPSPWTGWTIRQIGPRALEYMRPPDETRVMEFEEGVYRDRALEGTDPSGQDSEEWTIVEHGIHAPDNWRIRMVPPAPPGGPSMYAELSIAGDVFIWTNWLEQPDESPMRFMYFACQFSEE